MSRNVVRGVVGICLAVGMVVAAYGQGVYWETTRSGGGMGDRVVHENMYYMPKKFKTESVEEGQAMILRLDKGLISSINTKDTTYWESTFAGLDSMMKKGKSKMDASMAKMQKEMEGMPEGQRKMIEQMMKGKMPGSAGGDSKIEVMKTDETKNISGYPCTKFVVTENEKQLLTVWATKSVKEFDAMRKDFQEFHKRIMEMNPMIPKGIVEGMQKIDGFAIETDMPGGITQVVTKVERRSTPASAFEVPAGYTKVKPPSMGGEGEEEN